MSVAMKNYISAMAIDYLSKARATQVRIDFEGLSLDCVPNRRVVKNHDPLGGSQLRHGAFQLQSFVNGSLNERLDFGFAESGQRAASKTSGKALCAGKSDTIAFVSRTIKKLDAGFRHHPHEFGLATTLIVVISQHRYNRQTQPYQRVQKRLHFLRLAIVGKVSGDHQYIRLVSHLRELVLDRPETGRKEVQIGRGSNSHSFIAVGGGVSHPWGERDES